MAIVLAGSCLKTKGVPRLDNTRGKKQVGASMLKPKVFWK